jgi:hypothetical protein
MQDLQFGQFGLSVVLAVLMAVIFRVTGDIADRLKIAITVGVGLALGMLALPYGGMEWTVVNIVNCLMVGLMAAAGASGLYSWQSKAKPGAASGSTPDPSSGSDQKGSIAFGIGLILLIAGMVGSMSLQSCAPNQAGSRQAAMQSVVWYQDVKNWTPNQRANFFMDLWSEEKATYDAQNALTPKSADLIALLKVKQQILEKSRIPIRSYVTLVKSGGVPDAAMEQQIISWLRQLETQALTGP